MKKIYLIIFLLIIISAIIVIPNLNTTKDKKLPSFVVKSSSTQRFENYLSENNKLVFFKVQVPNSINTSLNSSETVMNFNTIRENGKIKSYTIDKEDTSIVIEYALYKGFDKLNADYIKDRKFEEVTRIFK